MLYHLILCPLKMNLQATFSRVGNEEKPSRAGVFFGHVLWLDSIKSLYVGLSP
jgi:uncharacterized membrane protein YagU involved in acid resistance